MIIPIPQPEPQPTYGSIMGTAWELAVALYDLREEDLQKIIEGAEKHSVDPFIIKMMRLVLAMRQMYVQLGLDKEQAARRAPRAARSLIKPSKTAPISILQAKGLDS